MLSGNFKEGNGTDSANRQREIGGMVGMKMRGRYHSQVSPIYTYRGQNSRMDCPDNKGSLEVGEGTEGDSYRTMRAKWSMGEEVNTKVHRLGRDPQTTALISRASIDAVTSGA